MAQFSQPSPRPRKNRNEQDDPISLGGTGAHYNPVSSSAQGTLDDIDQVLADRERLAAKRPTTPTGTAAGKSSGGVSAAENNPMGYQPDGLPNADTPRLRGAIGRLRNNRKALVGLGATGGILTIFVAGFLALIPLKLEMLIKSATQHAAEIPEHAIENRLQYLTSRYIAQRVLSAANPADTYPEGSIVKQLYKTWMAGRYEDQLGIKIESNRTNNGQTATSWKVTFKDSPTLLIEGGGEDIELMTKKIDSSKDMSKFMKTTVREKTKWHQFYKRYAMRKTLMRVFGVTRWAWLPETLSDKLDTYTAKKNELINRFKKRLYEATIKRVMPRTALYLACLSDSAECPKIKDHRFGTAPETPNSKPLDISCAANDQACVDSQSKLAGDAAADTDANAGSVSGSTEELGEAVGKEGGKFVTKQLLSKIVGGLGIVDTLARIVNGLDNGDANQIIYDRNRIMAAGYSTELLSINDEWKAGKLTPEQFDAAMTQLGDYGSSPAWQNEIGILAVVNPGAFLDPSASAATTKRYERTCGSDGEKTVLPVGELVCPERKIITDKTAFTNEPWWQPIASFAKTYLGSAGKLFDLFNTVVGGLAEKSGFNDAIGFITKATGLGDLFAKATSNILELVFGAPISPLDTDAEAGDDALAGIKSSYFALGETGQDTDQEGNLNGKGLGLGGQVMTVPQTAALKSQIAAENQDEWNQKSVFAKLFDTGDTRSMVSQLVLRTPTDGNQLAALPNMIQSTFASLFMPKTSAAGTYKDAFGFNFDYNFPDSTYTANPALYTTDYCKASAEKREASYKPGKEVSKDFPIYVYTESDPCALEKVVAASGAAFVDNSYSDDFALEGANGAGGTPAAPVPGGPGSNETPSAQGFVWPVVAADYKPLSNCLRNAPNGHTGIDIPVDPGTPVHAANAGKVVAVGGPNGDAGNYIIIEHAGGHWSNYQHLSAISVKVGDTVTAGQNIGKSGGVPGAPGAGNTTGAHLHFSITTQKGLDSRNSVSYSINPIPFLPKGRNLGVCS